MRSMITSGEKTQLVNVWLLMMGLTLSAGCSNGTPPGNGAGDVGVDALVPLSDGTSVWLDGLSQSDGPYADSLNRSDQGLTAQDGGPPNDSAAMSCAQLETAYTQAVDGAKKCHPDQLKNCEIKILFHKLLCGCETYIHTDVRELLQKYEAAAKQKNCAIQCPKMQCPSLKSATCNTTTSRCTDIIESGPATP